MGYRNSTIPGINQELEKLAAAYPHRHFWYVHSDYAQPGWCTKPNGADGSDIVRRAAKELWEALAENYRPDPDPGAAAPGPQAVTVSRQAPDEPGGT